jgi:hypothetical protein
VCACAALPSDDSLSAQFFSLVDGLRKDALEALRRARSGASVAAQPASVPLAATALSARVAALLMLFA